jgi:hypothetical protein
MSHLARVLHQDKMPAEFFYGQKLKKLHSSSSIKEQITIEALLPAHFAGMNF